MNLDQLTAEEEKEDLGYLTTTLSAWTLIVLLTASAVAL